MTTRDLIFSIWCANGESQTATIAALKQVAAGQYNTVKRGGAYLISSSVSGQSFSFQIPASIDPLGMVSLCRSAWLEIKDLSDSDFTTYLTQTECQSIRPTFANAWQ